MNKHKWCDVIVAFANGHAVQTKVHPSNEWADYRGTMYSAPWDAHNVEWRIKPKTIEGWINLYQRGSYNSVTQMYNTKKAADQGAAQNRTACIHIEYTEGEGL